MPTAGYRPIAVKNFGGLCTNIDPTNLPFNSSPDCQDVEFLPGLVRTRPGLGGSVLNGAGSSNINYLKTYVTPNQQLRTMVGTNAGNLFKEDATSVPGTLVFVFGPGLLNAYINSITQFEREYMAFGDGQYGYDLPRQYDDVNLDRVSQEGPGQAPGATDESISFPLAAAPNGAQELTNAIVAAPNGLTQSGFIVTVKITAASLVLSVPFAKVGDSFQIAGAGVAAYNGTWTILSIISSTQFTFLHTASGLAASGGGTVNWGLAVFTLTTLLVAPLPFGGNGLATVAGVAVPGYNSAVGIPWPVRGVIQAAATSVVAYLGATVLGLANSGAGSIAPAGNIVAGKHQLSVVFVTRSGYITAPASPISWTASGGKRVVVNGIPIGPPNVVQRILIFTGAGGDSFFYVVDDTTIFSSNMVINDNTTTTVTVDFSDAILLSGTLADPLFDLIELAESAGVIGYSSRLFWWLGRNTVKNFNNLGFDGGFSQGTAPFPLGWSPDATNYAGGGKASSSVFGDAYKILGDGVTSPQGKISQTAFKDAFGNPILSGGTAYTISAYMTKSNLFDSPGSIQIQLISASAGYTQGINVSVATLSISQFSRITANCAALPANVPSDLILQVQGSNLQATQEISIDVIEVYPTLVPFEITTARASKVEDPESFDGVSGFLNVAEQNGQAIRSAFVLRNNLYFVKDRSMYVTQDDGVNEPNQWPIQEISAKVGTPSVRGVGVGDEWAVIAGLDGVYLFQGGQPQKISQEIQPTWDSINWSFGYLIDVKVDTKRQRIYISVPLGASATQNNRVITLDYTEGWGDSSSSGIGRKWSPWAIAASSQNLILRNNGVQQLWFGSNFGGGVVNSLDTTGTVFNDNGNAVAGYWQSGFAQDGSRLSFGYLLANVVGSGNCNLLFRKGDMGWTTNARSWLMSSLGFHNMERQIKFDTERLAVRFGTSALNDHFSLQGFELLAKESAWQPVRGINAP